MSSTDLNPFGVPLVPVVDNRMCANKVVYGVYRGGTTHVVRTFPTGGLSPSTMQYVINVPSTRHIMSRRVMMRKQLLVTFTGVAAVGNLLKTNAAGNQIEHFDGLRAFPMEAMQQTITFTIAGEDFSCSASLFAQDLLPRYFNNFYRSNDCSIGEPVMPDCEQRYVDSSNTAKDPLGQFNNNALNTPRADKCWIEILTNTPTSASVRVTLNTIVFLSPLSTCPVMEEGMGFTGLVAITVNENLNNLHRIWSHDAQSVNASTITNTNVVIEQASVRCLFLGRPQTWGSEQVPRLLHYPRWTMDSTSTVGPLAVAPGGIFQIQSGVQTFITIPDREYAYVRRPTSQRSLQSSIGFTDTFFRILSISVNFNGNDNLLSEMNSYDLWKISRDEGVQMDFSDWFSHSGGVLCLKFGKVIPLLETQSVGLVGSWSFQLTMNCQNISSEALDAEMLMWSQQQSLFTTEGNSGYLRNGYLSEADVLRVGEKMPRMLIENVASSVVGGSFLSKIGDFFSSGFGKTLADAAVDIGSSVIKKKLGGSEVDRAELNGMLSGGSMPTDDVSTVPSIVSKRTSKKVNISELLS